MDIIYIIFIYYLLLLYIFDDAVRQNNALNMPKEKIMQVSRRIQANATGPDALSAQRSVREVNIVTDNAVVVSV